MSKVGYNDFGKIGLYLLMTFMSLAAGLIMTAAGITALMQDKRRCSKKRGSEKERSVAPMIIAAGVLLTFSAFALFFTLNMFII